MIEIPEDGWDADVLDVPGSLLDGMGGSGEPSLGRWSWADEDLPQGSANDPDKTHERASGVFRRQRSIGAFNRELDSLSASIAEAPDWSDGLERFDRKVEELRQRHAGDLSDEDDREAFARHAGEFAAMQRIGLKRALVERQASDALTQLDEQLAYYADKAAGADNEVFRQIALDSGLRAIDELREAGYLTAESAEARKAMFLNPSADGAANNPGDLDGLIHLAGNLLDSGINTPEANALKKLLEKLLGGGLPRRRPRSDEPQESPAPVPPRLPKPPLVTPPNQFGDQNESSPQPKSEQEITTARARWKEQGLAVDQFGPVFEDLRGNWKEGVQRLLREQDGQIPEALRHPKINDSIDLIWGDAGTGKGDGYGLAKIVRFHPEVLDDLPQLITEMSVISRSKNRIRLESERHHAAVRLEFDGKKKTWLLTAFEKEDWALRSTEDGQAEPHGRTDSSATGPAKDKH
jgi:hypothetical protein